MSTRYAFECISSSTRCIAAAENALRGLRLGIVTGDLDDSDLGDLEAMEHRLEEARRIGRTLARVLNDRSRKAER